MIATKQHSIRRSQPNLGCRCNPVIGIALLCYALVVNATNDAQPQFEKMPEIALMPKLTGQWVAKRIILNGLPASIFAFSGPVKIDDVVANYETIWRSKSDAVTHRNGVWRILATKHKGHFVTLQVRPDGAGAQGLIVVSGDPAEYANAIQTDFPLPPGLRVVNHQSFIDSGKRAQTITLQSEQLASIERAVFEYELTSSGWTLISAQSAETLRDGYTLEFRKGTQHARIFLANDEAWDNRTMILITWLQN